MARLRVSATRGRPFGDDVWVERTAAALGLTHTLRPTGRPRKPTPTADVPGGGNQ